MTCHNSGFYSLLLLLPPPLLELLLLPPLLGLLLRLRGLVLVFLARGLLGRLEGQERFGVRRVLVVRQVLVYVAPRVLGDRVLRVLHRVGYEVSLRRRARPVSTRRRETQP